MIFDATTKNYETRSDYPNENWTGEEGWQVIPDGSELSDKIIKNYPFFDPVLDDDGICIDVKVKRGKKSVVLSPEDQINQLKAQLAASNDKIVECMEFSLAGEDLPYDAEALHAERQAIRDEINRLEEAIK